MNVSRRIADLKPLATTAMHGRVEAMQADGREVIDFSIAISHFPPPPAVTAAVQEGLRQTTLPYTSVAGSLALRGRLAQRVARDNGIPAEADEIIVTNGAKQALYEALYVMSDPGQRVIIFRPYWPAYVATCRLLGLETVLVDLPDEFTDAFLDSLPQADILIVNNPHNPTGAVLKAADIERIAAWMARRGVRAVVDESYETLIFDGAHHSLAARQDWRSLGIVTLFSCSQSHAMMGWRAGFAVAPRAIAAAMETLQGPITAAAPALTQLALDAAFAAGTPPAMLADYRRRRDTVLEMLSGVAWMKMTCPASGPYLWADISPLGMECSDFTEGLLQHGAVALMPGEALGVSRHIRLGFIGGDEATLRRGVSALIHHGDGLAAGKREVR